VVESSGYTVRTVLKIMEGVGCRAADLRVSGGLARLPLWCQAKADITGTKVMLPEQEESDLVGNACAGFFGLGEFETPAAAAESLVRFQKVYLPNPAAREEYDELFEIFTTAVGELGGTFKRLTPGA
jgi:xylulokinase